MEHTSERLRLPGGPTPWLLLCFLLSGAAGLIFQTCWSQELGLVLGASDLAVATVLAAFMGGLALGAGAAARLAGRARRPLRLYAWLELGVAASASLLPLALGGVMGLEAKLLGGVDITSGSGAALSLGFYAVAAFGLLLLPTMLMGATLPVLARFAVASDAELGRRVGTLYTVNTLGAALGAFVGPFVLLPRFGLGGAELAAAGLNVAAAFLALTLGRRATALEPAAPRSRSPRARFAWILPLMALSGAVSFTWEVLWTRLLTHLLGGSIYAFGAMLASALAGLALGAELSLPFTASRERARSAWVASQLGAALASSGAFALLDVWPGVVERAAPRAADAFSWGALAAALTLLPGAIFLGATVPLAVRLAACEGVRPEEASGRVLAWNTGGAIAGALAAGYWLMPALGFARLAAGAVAGSLLLALAVALLPRPRRPVAVLAAALGLAALALLPPSTPWHLLRWGMIGGAARGEVEYLGVGRAATVLLTERADSWRLTTNGLPESLILKRGASRSTVEAAGFMSLLPAALRPAARSLLVVGLGGGVILEGVPRSIEQIDVVELEPEVIAANRCVAARRDRNPLADPRLRILVHDARSILALATARYDAIVSQPSHPWTAGSAHLFTEEFFTLARERLSEDGIFVQWVGVGFLDGELLRSILAALTRTFPEVEMYQPGGGPSFLFVAGRRPVSPGAGLAASLAADAATWAELGVRSPQDLLRDRLLTTAGARALAAGASPNTDRKNRLQSAAPKVLARLGAASSAFELLLPHDPIAEVGGDPLALLRGLLRAGQRARAERFAAALTDPVASLLARAQLLRALGREGEAEARFRDALALAPGNAEALAGLLGTYRGALAAGRSVAFVEGLTDPAARTLAAAFRASAPRRWRELSALDGALAAVPAHHALGEEALRLRIAWRLESGDRADAAEALHLLDRELPDARGPRDQLLRAEAALAAGDRDGAIGLAEVVIEALERQRQAPPWTDRLDALLARLSDPAVASLRQRLAQLRG